MLILLVFSLTQVSKSFFYVYWLNRLQDPNISLYNDLSMIPT